MTHVPHKKRVLREREERLAEGSGKGSATREGKEVRRSFDERQSNGTHVKRPAAMTIERIDLGALV